MNVPCKNKLTVLLIYSSEHNSSLFTYILLTGTPAEISSESALWLKYQRVSTVTEISSESAQWPKYPVSQNCDWNIQWVNTVAEISEKVNSVDDVSGWSVWSDNSSKISLNQTSCSSDQQFYQGKNNSENKQINTHLTECFKKTMKHLS